MMPQKAIKGGGGDTRVSMQYAKLFDLLHARVIIVPDDLRGYGTTHLADYNYCVWVFAR